MADIEPAVGGAQSVGDMDARFVAGGCGVPSYSIPLRELVSGAPAELRPPAEHEGAPGHFLAKLLDRKDRRITELEAENARREKAVAAWVGIAEFFQNSARRQRNADSRLSASWHHLPDVTAPQPRTFPARALRFGKP